MPAQRILRLTMLLPTVAFLAACSGHLATVLVTSSGASTANQQSLEGNISLRILNSDGSVAYTDTTPNSSLNLESGKTYQLVLDVSGFPTGTSFALQSSQIDTVSGSNVSIPLNPGSNSFTVPAQGDYAWKIVASAPNAQSQSKSYLANITCANPTFTQSSLNPSAISVTQGSFPNLYNFSASGVVAGANGMGPYQCEWDPTGTGIVDTGFADCSTALQNEYVNYVGLRNVGLIVKDACNTTYAISAPVTLPYSEPSMPGNVFIYGQTSNASGAAVGDSRIDNVDYLATNANNVDKVQPQYGGGTFQIVSTMNYQGPSSVPFGMNITVKGIQDNIDVSSGTGSVSAANAYVSSVSFTTDQAGDEEPSVTYQGSNCQLSNQGAKVLFTQGQPCTTGTSGDQNEATVEVWGHYTCKLATSNGTGGVDIAGDFDGYTNMVDNCVGGGGGGGGGIVPINF